MDMDWEPEVPGQWNTPIRIRRQHAVAEVALLNAFSHTESPVSKGYVSTLIVLMQFSSSQHLIAY
jgi:hypothetical protein